MKNLIFSISLLMGLTVSQPVLSVESAGIRPSTSSEFSRAGTIDRIDIRAGEIVINDTLYELASNVSLHSGGASSSLKNGMRIGFNTNAQRQVTDIWQLSDQQSNYRD